MLQRKFDTEKSPIGCGRYSILMLPPLWPFPSPQNLKVYSRLPVIVPVFCWLILANSELLLAAAAAAAAATAVTVDMDTTANFCCQQTQEMQAAPTKTCLCRILATQIFTPIVWSVPSHVSLAHNVHYTSAQRSHLT